MTPVQLRQLKNKSGPDGPGGGEEKEAEEEAEYMETEGERVGTQGVPRGNDSSIHTVMEYYHTKVVYVGISDIYRKNCHKMKHSGWEKIEWG